LLSVNVGVPLHAPSCTNAPGALTGFDKRPVSGPVHVTVPGSPGSGGSGLAGDTIGDLRHHGGPDQAVYAYAREDLDDWAAELGRELADGSFAENLTTVGLDVNGALIGERWRIGERTELETAAPRTPCRTFAAWIGEPDWLRRFTERGRPGAYLRVIKPGPVCAGDPVRVVHRPDHGVTVALLLRALTGEPELLPRVLDAGEALPEAIRRKALRRTGGRRAPVRRR
jgi:MOSC domain-containing protein YiiM